MLIVLVLLDLLFRVLISPCVSSFPVAILFRALTTSGLSAMRARFFWLSQ